MYKHRKFYLLIGLVLFSLYSLAQDTISDFSEYSKYREDQFYVGASYNLVFDVPSGVKTRGLTGGLQFGFLRDMPINERRNIAVAVGAGFAFNNIGQTLFIGETTNEETIFTVLDDQTVDYTRNRISISTIEMPLEFRWRSSSPGNYKFWRVYAGFRVGYAYWYKTTFKQPGNNVNQTDIPEFERVRLGTSLSFGYNTFNFFAYYSLNPFFKDGVTTSGQAVNFRMISVGLMFYIL